MKEFTITRRRTVVQIQTDIIEAETEEQALEIVNQDQVAGEFHEANEWHTLDDAIEYPVLNCDDILEVTEVI